MANTATTGIRPASREEVFEVEESFRTLRSNLLLIAQNAKKCFLITSALAGEGKSTIAASLSVFLGASGRKTLLVDADLRRPTLHTIFGKSNSAGLSDILVNGGNAPEFCQPVRENLFLLSSGSIPRDPQALFSGPHVPGFFHAIRSAFEIIVIDSPPVLSCVDSALLAPHADGVVVVLASGGVKASEVSLVRRRLVGAGATILGSVLNRARRGVIDFYHPYGTGTLQEGKTKSLSEAQLPGFERAAPAGDSQ